MCFFNGKNPLASAKAKASPNSATGLLSTRTAYNDYAIAEAEAGRPTMSHMDWAKSKAKRK